MRNQSIFDQPIFVVGRLGLLVICLGLLLASNARAGDWSFEVLGPGADPSHVRIRVEFIPDPTINCINPCDYVMGSFDGRISPAPPAQEIFGAGCLEKLLFDETGATFGTPCAGLTLGYFEIDLDPAISYAITGAYIGAWLEGGCQGGACCPDDFCSGSDSNFAQLDIPSNPVPVPPLAFSSLKARF